MKKKKKKNKNKNKNKKRKKFKTPIMSFCVMVESSYIMLQTSRMTKWDILKHNGQLKPEKSLTDTNLDVHTRKMKMASQPL